MRCSRCRRLSSPPPPSLSLFAMPCAMGPSEYSPTARKVNLRREQKGSPIYGTLRDIIERSRNRHATIFTRSAKTERLRRNVNDSAPVQCDPGISNASLNYPGNGLPREQSPFLLVRLWESSVFREEHFVFQPPDDPRFLAFFRTGGC